MTAQRPTVHDLATQTAASYKRRCWWADRGDLYQVARVAALQARRTYDPTTGVPRTAYYRRAMVLAVRRWLWEQSSPVSGGLHRPERDLAGVHRAPMSGVDEQAMHMLRGTDPTTQQPDTTLDDERWRAAVRQRLQELSGDWGGHAVQALLHAADERPDDAVLPNGAPAATKRAVRTLKRHARNDAQLYQLLQSRLGRGGW